MKMPLTLCCAYLRTHHFPGERSLLVDVFQKAKTHFTRKFRKRGAYTADSTDNWSRTPRIILQFFQQDPNFVVHVSRIFTKPSPNIINAIVKLANDNTRTGDGNTQEQRAIFTLNKLGVRELVQWRKMPSSSIMHSFVLVTVRSLLIELPLFSISLKAIAAFWCRWMLENVKIASMSVCRDRTEKYLILTLKIDSIPPKLFTELVFMALSWIVGKPHEIHEGIWIHHIRLVSHL